MCVVAFGCGWPDLRARDEFDSGEFILHSEVSLL